MGNIDVMRPSMVEADRRRSTQPSVLSQSDEEYDDDLDHAFEFLSSRRPHLPDTLSSSDIIPLSATSPLSNRRFFNSKRPADRFPRTPGEDRLSALSAESIDPYARGSFATDGSRISELMNEFPSPPPEDDITLTPSVMTTLLGSYFPATATNEPSPTEGAGDVPRVLPGVTISSNGVPRRTRRANTFGDGPLPFQLHLPDAGSSNLI